MPEECTLRTRKGQYRDKVEWITYRIPDIHTEKENGKCHVAGGGRSRARRSGRTNARKRESRKIRERAFTCVENLDRYRSRGRYTGIGRTPGNKYNKGSGGANDVEWTKSAVSVEREGGMKGMTEIKEKIPPHGVRRDRKEESRNH